MTLPWEDSPTSFLLSNLTILANMEMTGRNTMMGWFPFHFALHWEGNLKEGREKAEIWRSFSVFHSLSRDEPEESTNYNLHSMFKTWTFWDQVCQFVMVRFPIVLHSSQSVQADSGIFCSDRYEGGYLETDYDVQYSRRDLLTKNVLQQVLMFYFWSHRSLDSRREWDADSLSK